MNVSLRIPRMTREEFFLWAEAQETRHEFDGFEPVPVHGDAVTGGSFYHGLLAQNLYAALRSRLRGSAFVVLGPDCGVATVGNAVRFPDALVTATPPTDGAARVIDGVIVLFEILSPSTTRTDRLIKPREYTAIPSIHRYVILETDFPGATVLSRAESGQGWLYVVIETDAAIDLPELGVTLPMVELYAGLTFGPA